MDGSRAEQDAWIAQHIGIDPADYDDDAVADDGADAGVAAPVSMALPEGKDKPPSRPPRQPTKESNKPKVINFEPEELAGLDPTKVKAAIKAISGRAGLNATAAAVWIGQACTEFAAWAKPKLDEQHEDANTLFKMLLDGALDVIGAGLVAKVAEGVGRRIADAIKAQLKQKLVDTVCAGLKESSSNKALEEGLAKLINAAQDKSLVAVETITKVLDPYLDDIAAKAAKRPPALSREQHDFMVKFEDADLATTDTYLEGLGIPSMASAKEIHLATYKSLIKGFELGLVKREMQQEMGKWDFAEAARTDPIGVRQKIRHRAEERAETETSRRAEQMHQAGV